MNVFLLILISFGVWYLLSNNETKQSTTSSDNQLRKQTQKTKRVEQQKTEQLQDQKTEQLQDQKTEQQQDRKTEQIQERKTEQQQDRKTEQIQERKTEQRQDRKTEQLNAKANAKLTLSKKERTRLRMEQIRAEMALETADRQVDNFIPPSFTPDEMKKLYEKEREDLKKKLEENPHLQMPDEINTLITQEIPELICEAGFRYVYIGQHRFQCTGGSHFVTVKDIHDAISKAKQNGSIQSETYNQIQSYIYQLK